LIGGCVCACGVSLGLGLGSLRPGGIRLRLIPGKISLLPI
jgi:hypothetical protein